MGSVGNAPTHPQLGRAGKDIFSRNDNDFNKVMRLVNPNYINYQSYQRLGDGSTVNTSEKNRNKPYHGNCALCSVAGVLQLMGYDVEAMPRDKTWRGFDSVFDFDWNNHDNYIAPSARRLNYIGTDWWESRNNPNKAKQNLSQLSIQLDNKMQDWGEHSFAIMNVQWKGSRKSHAVVVYREKYHTTVMDFQNGQTQDIHQYIRTKGIKPSSVGLYRMDNAKLKDNIKDLDKIVKFRKRGK